MARLQFLKTALRQYRTVGAFAPVSRFVAQKVSAAAPEGAKLVIECGAGEGVVTRHLLGRLAENGTLVAIELLPEFTPLLRRIADTRLKVIEGDALAALMVWKTATDKPEAIVSNIPFSQWTRGKRRAFVAAAHASLAPGGALIIYQNVPVIARQMRELFGTLSWQFELRNFSGPYCILTARR